MKLKELKDLMKHFEDSSYDEYELVFWDYMRQQKMDGHFGGLSHPDKEITIPITDVGEKFFPKAYGQYGIPEVVQSPFVEGKSAYLKKDENYEMNGVTFERLFYECEETHKCFSTSLSDTITMNNFYREEIHKYREEIQKLKEEK